MMIGAGLLGLVALNVPFLIGAYRSTSTLYLFLAFFLELLMSTVGSHYRFEGGQTFAVWMGGLGFFLAFSAMGERVLTWALRGLTAAATILVAMGVQAGLVSLGRLHATFSNPDCLGFFLLLPVAIAAADLAMNKRMRLFASFELFCLTVGLMLTGSRSAWLGTVAIAGVLAYYLFKRYGNLRKTSRVLAVYSMAVLAVCLVGLLSTENSPLQRAGALWSDGNGFELRAATVSAGLHSFIRSPILGAGPGSFVFATQPFRRRTSYPGYFNQADCDMIQTLAEIGLAGWLLLWGIWIGAIRSSLRVKLVSRQTWYCLGLGAGLLGALLYSLSGYALAVPANVFLCTSALGAVCASLRMRNTGDASQGPRLWPVALALVMLGGAAWAFSNGLSTWRVAKLLSSPEIDQVPPQEVLERLSEAIRLQPSNEALYFQRAQRLFSSAPGRHPQDRAGQITADLDKAISLNPRAIDLRTRAAKIYLGLGQGPHAELILLGQLGDYPEDGGAWEELAEVQLANNDARAAVVSALRAALIDSFSYGDALPTILAYAQTAVQAGAPVMAEALKSSPDPEKLYSWCLAAGEVCQDPMAAEAFYRLVMAGRPQDVRAQVDLGLAELKEHSSDSAEGISLLEHAVEEPAPLGQDQQGALAAQQKGTDYLVQRALARNDRPAAMHYLEVVLRISPWENRYRLQLATLLVEDNRPDDAVSLFQMAISHDPSNSALYVALGDLCYQQGMFDLASDSYQTACRLQPKNALFHAKLQAAQQGQSHRP
jgi:tetratricopeptide (TPR) repeat protein